MPTNAHDEVARFTRERPIAFDDAMDATPLDHLEEFWNWLNSQSLLPHHPTVRAEVLTVGELGGDEEVLAMLVQRGPMALLRTGIEGARVLGAIVGTEVEFRIRQPTSPGTVKIYPRRAHEAVERLSLLIHEAARRVGAKVVVRSGAAPHTYEAVLVGSDGRPVEFLEGDGG